jgi:hypothetical protein
MNEYHTTHTTPHNERKTTRRLNDNAQQQHKKRTNIIFKKEERDPPQHQTTSEEKEYKSREGVGERNEEVVTLQQLFPSSMNRHGCMSDTEDG